VRLINPIFSLGLSLLLRGLITQTTLVIGPTPLLSLRLSPSKGKLRLKGEMRFYPADKANINSVIQVRMSFEISYWRKVIFVGRPNEECVSPKLKTEVTVREGPSVHL
jgi:hypothetical protein